MTMKHIAAAMFALSLFVLASCGSSSGGSPTSSTVSAQETTVTTTTPTETTTAPIETTTTTTETTTTTATETTTATKEYDRSYYSFDEQKEIKLKYDIVLYYAPDKTSDGLYNFNAGTILIAVGETNDYFAVTMNGDIVFCEKVAADYYVEPVYTEAIPVVDEPEPTFVITD